MEALTAYAKYSGLYEEWCQIRKRYSLHWTNGDESLQSLQRFFNLDLTVDTMLQRIKEMVDKLPTTFMGKIVKFACLVGLRSSEVVESIRLLNSEGDTPRYYNEERQALEHFRFPQIFLRRTKKAYISFVTSDMIELVKRSDGIPADVPSYSAIQHACHRVGIACELHLCRKIFASHLRQSGIQPEVIDLLQGRVSQSILTRHYLVPSQDLKDRVLDSLYRLQQALLEQPS
jgi:intergrase/recombinase